MQNLLKKRLLTLPFVLIAVILFNFFLFHLSPGDPTSSYFGPKVKAETYDTLRQKMGLDDPWYAQLYNWTSRMLRGDLGYSWSNHRPVRDVLSEAIPATLLLTLVALFLNLILGCVLGLYAGLKHNRKSGQVLSMMALLLYAVPPFWLAIFFVYLFSTKLGWLPPSGMSSMTFAVLGPFETFVDHTRHLMLPASVLGLVGAAATFRFVRANVAHILDQDYIRFATAKGLSAKRILFKHVLKNALIPVVTLLGLYLPLLLGGAFIIEVIFAWPGMGRVTYNAILSKDFPLLMAVNLIVAFFVIAGNVLADALYNVVDPRVQLE